MPENQNHPMGTNGPRKIRKIKRVRPAAPQPQAYGMPSKVNYAEPIQPAPQDQDDLPLEAYFGDNGDSENIRFVTDEDVAPQDQETIGYFFRNKTVLLLLALFTLFGIIIGATMFSQKQAARGRGLDGVVFNQDVPAGRSRCGLVEPHQGCVLYIMNPKNQEVTGRDFFATAAQWTKRQRYLIDTGNMRYSNVRIKPGYIAQINIPPISNQ